MAALDLPAPAPMDIEEAAPKDYGQMYEDILAKLQIAVKRTEDKTAANLMKGVATFGEIPQGGRPANGVLFDQLELEDIGAMIGRKAASLADARRDLYAAAGGPDRQRRGLYSLSLATVAARRGEILCRAAAGSIHGRGWPALHPRPPPFNTRREPLYPILTI